MENQTRKRGKHIYDMKTKGGLPIIINLNVIRYIYNHIKKAERFMEPETREKGKRPKALPLYGMNEFPLSRQRLNRMNHGENFELTKREAADIVDAFGFEKKYFDGENTVAFEIEGIADRHWQSYFDYYYKSNDEEKSEKQQDNEHVSQNEAKERNKNNNRSKGNRPDEVKILEDALGKLVDNWKEQLNKDDPIYAICYFFYYGIRFDMPSGVDSLKKMLRALEFSEWDKEDEKSLRAALLYLEEHSSYISSLLTIKAIRTIKRNKNEIPSFFSLSHYLAVKEKRKQLEEKKQREKQNKRDEKKR